MKRSGERPGTPASTATTRRLGASTSSPARPPERISTWRDLEREIVCLYGDAWSRVMSRQPGLAYYYIEGYAEDPSHGAGAVPASASEALLQEPPFRHYFFLGLDGRPLTGIHERTELDPHVTLLAGDPNNLLLRDVLPLVRAEDYRRAICLLDARALQIDWRVIEAAGRLRTIDLFVTLPLVDPNGHVIPTRPHRAPAGGAARLTRAWGDDSWRAVLARPAATRTPLAGVDAANAALAVAFRRRLREDARFENVFDPVPMREDDGTVIGHLFFGSRSDTANHVLEEVFARHRA